MGRGEEDHGQGTTGTSTSTDMRVHRYDGGEMASALDGPSAWGFWDSGILGFWAVQSKRPSRPSARPQLFSPFGGRSWCRLAMAWRSAAIHLFTVSG